MNPRIRQLLTEITALEDELRTTLHEQEAGVLYRMRGRRIEFERSVRDKHRVLKRGLMRWIVAERPLNYVTAPVIYSLIIPMLVLDLFVSVYQVLCFPVYKIAKVPRGRYISADRRHLEYLNAIERFHCTFCAYANGLLAYATEIAARTEQYFCPIKHAHRMFGSHARYKRFLAYGDAVDYHGKLEEFRRAMEGVKEK